MPEWAAPALDALMNSKTPLKLSRAEIEELGSAGLPLKSGRKGTVLQAKVEAITLPPPEPAPSLPTSGYRLW